MSNKLSCYNHLVSDRKLVSHHSSQNDGRDSTSYERAIANIIVGFILGVGQVVHAVFKTVFQILLAIA